MPLRHACLVFLLLVSTQPALLVTVSAQAPQTPVKREQFSPVPGESLPQGAVARLGTLRLRHAGPVRQLSFSPDGKQLISLGADATVRYWDAVNGQELRRFQGKAKQPRLEGLSPDGKLLVTLNKTLQFWDTTTGQELPWSPGKQADPKEQNEFSQAEVRFAPDGRHFATVTPGPRREVLETEFVFQVWEVATGKRLVRADESLASGRAIWFLLNDGKLLIADHQQAVLREVGSARGVIKIPPEVRAERFGPWAMCLSPDERRLAARGEKHLRVWDVMSGKLIREMPMGPRGLFNESQDGNCCLALSPDGKLLAISSWRPGIEIWDVATGKVLHGEQGPVNSPQHLAYSPDGKMLACQIGLSTYRWQVETGQLLARHDLGTIRVATLQPFWDRSGELRTLSLLRANGVTLAGREPASAVQLFDAASGKSIWSFGDRATPCRSAALSPERRYLAALVGKQLILWNSENGKQDWAIPRENTGKEQSDWEPTLAFSADEKVLAVRGGYRVPQGRYGDHYPRVSWVVFLEVASAQPRGRLEWKLATDDHCHRDSWGGGGGHPEMDVNSGLLQLAPDARTMIFGGPQSLYQLDRRTGKEAHRFGAADVETRTAILSPNGRLLAAWTRAGAVQLWDVATGQALPLLQLPGAARVTCFAFSPDGRHLATGCSDTTILLWDIAKVRKATAAKVPPPKSLEPLWQALADADAAKADQAMHALASLPAEAVALLKQRLKPLTPPDAAKLRQLLANLDSGKFTVRQQAQADLVQLGDLALPALRAAAKEKNSLESSRRLEALIAQLEGLPRAPELLRALRAVELLEQIGTAAARELLASVAKGPAEHRLSQAAADSLRRLKLASGP